MPNFKLYRPDNLDDAIKMKTEHADVRYVAGGPDMIVNVRRGIEQPECLVDLTSISNMNDINLDKYLKKKVYINLVDLIRIIKKESIIIL